MNKRNDLSLRYLSLRKHIFYDALKEKSTFLLNEKELRKTSSKGKILYLYQDTSQIDKKEVLALSINEKFPKLKGKYYLLLDASLFDLQNHPLLEKADAIVDTYEKGISLKNPFALNDIYTKEVNKQYEKVFKKIFSLKDHLYEEVGITSKHHEERILFPLIDSIFKAFFMSSKEERINFIYDATCKKLDLEFSRYNLCGFKDNYCLSKAVLKKKGRNLPLIYGCCFTKGRICPYFNQGCTIQCLPCKLFTCKYLQKQGIKYHAKDFLLLKLFLSHSKLTYLDNAIYTPKEEIIDKLLN